MSSCVASSCTCFRKVLCASGTSASSPTASAPRSCHFAFICSAQHSPQNRESHIRQQRLKWSLALSQVRWTDDGDRKIHCCRNPTSFSSRHRHCCRMKRLSTARNFCVRQHAQSLCALPFYKPRLSTCPSLLLARVLRFHQLFISRCRLSCSAAQLRLISTPHLPTIEFA